MGTEFVFMDDNVHPHRANIVNECFKLEDITRMDWPAFSLDLNPVDHVWEIIGRRVAAHQPSPMCLPKLKRALLHVNDLSVGDMMYDFTVYFSEEELILPFWDSGIFISVHSPFIFNNLTLHKHQMKPGRTYEINIRLWRNGNHLGPPYKVRFWAPKLDITKGRYLVAVRI
ncbi:transposable element Tc3 transposase [Trichonephila clavipes]|nr:transposable element Tc3 transposase [Trichonephila clavipes]